MLNEINVIPISYPILLTSLNDRLTCICKKNTWNLCCVH